MFTVFKARCLVLIYLRLSDLNMKRRVVMNTQKPTYKNRIADPCTKHNKTKSLNKSSKTSSHVPSLRCHEELMSKLSPCTMNDLDSEPLNYTKKSQETKGNVDVRPKCVKRRDRPDDSAKIVNPKSVNVALHLSESAPVGEKDKVYKRQRPKGVSHFEQPNLEDSVDIIPVKLSSHEKFSYRPQNNLLTKQRPDSKTESKKKTFGSCRATWDKLLKISIQESSKDEIVHCGGSCETNNLQTGGSLPDIPIKKVIVSSNVNYQQADESEKCWPANEVEDTPESDKQPFHSFYNSDPIKTLDFLIKQLREKIIKQPENNNLQKIIFDMESALLKICVDNQDHAKINKEKYINNTVGSSTNTMSTSAISSGLSTKGKNGNLDIAQLQKGLEESCIFLQSLCIRQRESCNNHIREKEQLTLQLAESRRLLAVAKSKEKDYEVTIGELRLRIQEAKTREELQNQSIQELNKAVDRLKAEIEMLKPFKEAVKRLDVRLKETASEKEILYSKLHLKDLEIEKLKVLLEVKENLNPALKNKKIEVFKDCVEKEINLDVPVEDKSNSLLSLSTTFSWPQEKPGIMCSSQASSSPRHSPSPYNSWQHISCIYQRPDAASDLNKDIAGIFQNIKIKTEQNKPPQLDLEMPSSVSSFWNENEEQNINSNLVSSERVSESLSS